MEMCQSDGIAVSQCYALGRILASSKFLSTSCSSAYSLRLQLKVDCCTRFARPMIYSISSVQDRATRGAAKPQLPVPSSVAPLPCSSQLNVGCSHPLRKRRGQSVSDGVSRASLRVFAVNLPGSAAAQPPFSHFSNWGKAPCAFMGVWGRCEPLQACEGVLVAHEFALGGDIGV